MSLRFTMLLGSCLQNPEQILRREQHQPPIPIQHLLWKESPESTFYMILVRVRFSWSHLVKGPHHLASMILMCFTVTWVNNCCCWFVVSTALLKHAYLSSIFLQDVSHLVQYWHNTYSVKFIFIFLILFPPLNVPIFNSSQRNTVLLKQLNNSPSRKYRKVSWVL